MLGSFEYSFDNPYGLFEWQDATWLLRDATLRYNVSLSTIGSPLSSSRAPTLG